MMIFAVSFVWSPADKLSLLMLQICHLYLCIGVALPSERFIFFLTYRWHTWCGEFTGENSVPNKQNDKLLQPVCLWCNLHASYALSIPEPEKVNPLLLPGQQGDDLLGLPTVWEGLALVYFFYFYFFPCSLIHFFFLAGLQWILSSAPLNTESGTFCIFNLSHVN